MDNETIKRARQANLAEYLISVGVPLVRNGNRYKHKEHDSLTFTKNAYYWNSRQEHGNAIDYLVNHMNMSFKDAVSVLANTPATPMNVTASKQNQKFFDFEKLSLCQDTDKVKRYLNKTRYIGYSVINYLIDNKMLYQEEKTNNAVFPIYDESNNCIGAETQGTTSKRFKGIKAASKYGYGFNIRFTDLDEFDYALFFESAIDLISFIDYKTNHEKKSLDRCILISMSGLKINIIKHTQKAFKGKLTTVICIDNDLAGNAFIDELKNEKIPYIERRPADKYKDWNEQIKAFKNDNKPITRLINQQEKASLFGENCR